MNFLAHAYLSGNDEMVLTGNIIADGIKGKSYLKYPEKIQKGIILHRAIDTFTDQHVLTRHSASLLRPYMGRLAAVGVDVIYDHFLALHWADYHLTSFPEFVHFMYSSLGKYSHLMPSEASFFTNKMIEQDWISSYTQVTGIEDVFKRMSYRMGFPQLNEGGKGLKAEYKSLEADFKAFFPEIKAHFGVWGEK